MDSETKKDSALYANAMQQARHWAGVMKVLINQADERDRKSAVPPATLKEQALKDVARQLHKLAELKGSGVLTSEEFQLRRSA